MEYKKNLIDQCWNQLGIAIASILVAFMLFMVTYFGEAMSLSREPPNEFPSILYIIFPVVGYIYMTIVLNLSND